MHNSMKDLKTATEIRKSMASNNGQESKRAVSGNVTRTKQSGKTPIVKPVAVHQLSSQQRKAPNASILRDKSNSR